MGNRVRGRMRVVRGSKEKFRGGDYLLMKTFFRINKGQNPFLDKYFFVNIQSAIEVECPGCLSKTANFIWL